MSESIKVVCRFRGGQLAAEEWQMGEDEQSVSTPSLIAGMPAHTFTFDRVLDYDSTQQAAYNAIARDTIVQLLKGFNGTIFAYG